MATRMQQRRGTAAQWTSADPILASGEIGFETDTGQFKIGDGINLWSDLSYFKDIVDLGGNLDDYVPLTAVGANNGVASLNESGQVSPSQLNNVQTLITSTRDDLTADIETARLSAVDSSNTYTDTSIATEVINRNNAIDTAKNEAIGAAQTAQANAETTASGYVSTHASDTTSVHGISDTTKIVFTTDTGTVTDLMIANGAVSTDRIKTGAVTSEKIQDGTIVNGDIAGTAEIAQSKISGLVSDLAAKAPLAAPALTGNATAENLTISGNLTVNGTTTTVNASNLAVADSLIYLADLQYTTDSVDIGIYGAYGTSGNDESNHPHTGLIRDASDGKWKLVSGTSEPVSNVIDFTGATYDTIKLGGVEFSDGTQVKQGVPSLTSINQQSGAYTPVLTDRDKLIEINSASGVTVTIPLDSSVAYPVGTSFDILQTGSGQVTIAGAGGVTVNATPGLKLRTQWSSATLFKRATDTWVVFGDLTA